MKLRDVDGATRTRGAGAMLRGSMRVARGGEKLDRDGLLNESLGPYTRGLDEARGYVLRVRASGVKRSRPKSGRPMSDER